MILLALYDQKSFKSKQALKNLAYYHYNINLND